MSHALAEAVLQGSRRALARVLTLIENQTQGADEALATLFPHTGKAWLIGVTGSPGTGKSTLVTALAKAFRGRGRTVAILAVDPTSPFTGGAILGDRIRMNDLSGDSGVFIRSMATRGNLGGLSATARDATRALDAAGFDILLIETVGAGQSEVEIARLAYTTLVVEVPGLGDEVQAFKAGILEIADVLVVNKADRPGADNTVRALRTMLDLGHPNIRATMVMHHGDLLEVAPVSGQIDDALWLPPIVETVASESRGLDALVNAIENHREFLQKAKRREALELRQIEGELYNRLRDLLLQRTLKSLPHDMIVDMLHEIAERRLTPQVAVQSIIAKTNQNHA
jgi:LAO/AO transport system kinase